MPDLESTGHGFVSQMGHSAKRFYEICKSVFKYSRLKNVSMQVNEIFSMCYTFRLINLQKQVLSKLNHVVPLPSESFMREETSPLH